LEWALSRIRRIDSREGRSATLVELGESGQPAAAPGRVPDVRVFVGQVESPILDSVAASGADIHLAFDAWTCALKRGATAGRADASAVPFGALAGACFAVAEVFKTLVASAVSTEEAASFRRRFTHEWRFSAWTMERVIDNLSPAGPPDALPRLEIDSVLQVGAGAVGNASALAFISTQSLAGILAILDPKAVDIKNLNRCYFFTEDDVGSPKVVVVEREARGGAISILGEQVDFDAGRTRKARIILSTVDNNSARHRIQEALPAVVVEGATGGTAMAVGVHTPGNGRSCLVCRHPDPAVGTTRLEPLSLSAAATLTGLSEEEIAAGRIDGSVNVTDELINRVAQLSVPAAESLRRSRNSGHDLCGALGDLRATLGTIVGPNEAAIPFVSNLAGVLAAAEAIKHLLRASGMDNVPMLDNVIAMDLARDYGRHTRLSFCEPPRSDCSLCQARADIVADVLSRRALLTAE
jgi:molybdopterin/thiamine biosynthesis adenylyltransferase